MDDLDDVRAWLGYDRINLIGSSYGTRAALVYLRQHPERVRTVTLIGVAPTYLKMPMYHAQAAARAMELLLQQCEQDAQCHEAFPQIRDDWTSVLSQLGREPARVEYSPSDKSAPVNVEIQRDIFAEKIRTWMYGRDQASRIPLIIHHAAQGDFAPFLREAIRPSIPDFIADGMYLSVTCAEDIPFINQEEAARLNAGNPFGNYRVFQQTRACSMWPQGKIPPDFREPVSSNVPVLIFSGNMDPVTPPQRGEEVARYLPNSRHVIIPQAGHGFDGLAEPECADRIIMEFMEKGEAKDLDRWLPRANGSAALCKRIPLMIALQTAAQRTRGDEMDHGRSSLILRGHQIDLVILKRHDKLPAPLESACRWLSFFPLIKSSLK